MNTESKKGVISCKCGQCSLKLADKVAKLSFRCGCCDCRQAMEYGYVKGGPKPGPLPRGFYMTSDIIYVKGKEFMKAYQLRQKDPSLLGTSTRVYCTECYSIIGIDHPYYQDNIFLNFPEVCDNKCDLDIELTAFVWMKDYNEKIGPLPEEDIPLFVDLTFSQEINRLMKIPAVANAFQPPKGPIKGFTFTSIIAELGPVEVLNLEKAKRFSQGSPSLKK